MTTRKTNIGSLPAIPAGLAPDLRRFFEGVSESLQTMQGQRGDKLDRAVRLRDLQPGTTIGSALINAVANQVRRDDTQPVDPLSPPTNFKAIAAFSSVMLVWDYNRSPNYDRTEVFRASVELDANGNLLGPIPEFSEAYAYGAIAGDRFNDTISSGYRYYYWVRHVNTSDIPGAFTGPVNTVASALPSEILDKIESELRSSEFTQYLSTSVVDPKVNSIQNQINQSIQTLDSDLSSVETTVGTHQQMIAKLGPVNPTSGKYTFQETLTSVNDAQSLLLTRLGSYDSAKGRYSTFNTLYQASEDHTSKLESLGAFNSTTGKYAFLTTLSDVRSEVTAISNILGAANPVTGKYAFFADIVTANEKGTRIENALGGFNVASGKYAFQLNQQQANESTASSLNQLTALTLPFNESLVSERTWVIGSSGPQSKYSYQNGSNNRIVTVIGPYSSPTNAWRGQSTGGNGADGGFHSDSFAVDSTKTYRFSVWVRASETTTIGSAYLGLYTGPNTVQTLAGVSEGNPYFALTTEHASAANRGRWLLFVGILHPAGYSGGDTGVSGIYDPATGARLFAGVPYRMSAGTTSALIRAYQYYCGTSTTSVVDFAHPRVDVLDGTEPSFADLLRPPVMKAVLTDFARVSSDMDKVKAERTLKVDAGGKVAGFGLLADSVLGSKISFAAGQIEFVNNDGTDKDLGLGLLVKNGGLYFNKATAREIVVEDITFKRGIGVDLSVIESLQLPIGKITEANIAPAFLNRIILRDPNAVVTGGNQSIVRSINFANQAGQTGSFITAPIVGGNGLTRITINVSLDARETLLQTSRPAVPTFPGIRFKIMRGTTEILIPTDVMNAVNANPYGYTLVRGTGEYILTGIGYVEEGGYTTGGARFWERGVHLSAQFAFDGGYYSGSSGFTLNIIGLNGSIGTASMSMNVFEASSSSDGLIVKTEWSNIQSKPNTIAGFGIVDGVSTNGGNLFSGSGSYRAFSIRNTDPNGWSWFAMGGSSDSSGSVWHIATNGSATDIGLAGAFHIRGNNGSDSSMVINQDHTVRFRSLNLYAGATNGSNGWRLWHDGNAPVFATRWPTLAEIGAIGTGGGSFSGLVTFNANTNTNAMFSMSSPMTNEDDHMNSPISIRERGRVGSSQSNNKYAPNLNFHWSGYISNSLWMDAAGTLLWGPYESDGTPTANGVFSTSWIFGSTYSTIGKGGMILYNGTAGMVLRTQDAGGGFARGIVAENAAGTRLAGAGFYGDSGGVYSFAISLKENWWATPQFEIVPSNINLNTTYLTLTQGWDISWGGRWSSGYPTMTGNSATIYLYPNGSTGGAYALTTTKLQFPNSFNTYVGPSSGVLGFFTDVGNAKSIAVGGLTVSNAYSDVSRTDPNGLYVKGRTKIENSLTVVKSDVNLNNPIWHPDGATAQLYSADGVPVALCFHRGGFTATGLVHDGDGLYLTDGTFRAVGFKMKGRATTITTGASNVDAISIQSPYGYVDIGALNTSFAHFTTDRPYFYMNKELSVNVGLDVYGTQWFFGRNSKAKIGSFQARHVDGLSPDGTLYDTLYLNYINNNDVMVGYNGGAKLIARSSDNEVMSRWLKFVDTRSVGLRPTNGYGADLSLEFLAGATAGNSGESYIGSIVFRPYGWHGDDWSGGPIHKLHFGQDSGRIWHQTGNGSGWGSYREIPQYEPNGYLYARSWINITDGQGLFWGSGTHFFSVGNGQMVLRGGSPASHLAMQTNGGVTQGYLYAEAGGNIGFLGQNALWALRVDANNMVWVTDITATSDSRYKDNQRVIPNALTKLRAHLNGKTFNRNDKGGEIGAGLIAQDVIKALPEAVTVNPNTGHYSVNYNGVIGLLVEAIKELAAKVDRLEAQWQQ